MEGVLQQQVLAASLPDMEYGEIAPLAVVIPMRWFGKLLALCRVPYARPGRMWISNHRGRRKAAQVAHLAAALALATSATNAADQDACDFGATTNREYHSIYQKARQLGEGGWPELSSALKRGGGSTAAGQILESRLSKLVSNEDTLDRRIAAVHAMLRALGAEFRNENYDLINHKPDRIRDFGPTVRLNYSADQRRLTGDPEHPYTDAWIVVHVRQKVRESLNGLAAIPQIEIRFILNAANQIERVPDVPRGAHPCPRVPGFPPADQ